MGPTLLSFVNENKPFAPDFGLFEIGRVCEGVKEDGLCNERKKLGIALYSRTRSEKELYMELLEIFTALGRDIKRADFTFKNGEPRHGWQHPRNTAFASYKGQELGWLCALHPAVAAKLDKKAAVVCAQLDMDAFAAIQETDIAYREPSRFPGIDIDLSLALPQGMTYAQLAPAWADLDAETLSSVTLIDSFQQAPAEYHPAVCLLLAGAHPLKRGGPALGGRHRGKIGKSGGSPALLSGFSPAKGGASGKVLAFPGIILYDKG